MIQKTRAFNFLVAAALILVAGSVHAAGDKDFGDYRVHWNVFPSTFLTPEVAKANQLHRSKSIGIVNVSIMKENEDGTLSPVDGQLEGKQINDIQQVKFMAFRRIREGDSVYFIAEYQYISGELITFNITARPRGHSQGLPIRFAHTLFND